ncbi:metabolite traffic protein EboE [Streptomyces sp. YIM 98790]|uniref:metabolite traffic protein EboE n=1 Tax=Streptomyces sp. YIM 98790 TaxID=2689077 RepID=UPI00140BCECA|nr:metabolite traffic protein EboE [Streptomyces sp. YIM 98790]
MRFTHPDGTAVHLAYCTNVHPLAEDPDELTAQVCRFGAAVRARLGVSRLGLGLWLPAPAAARLAAGPAAAERLRAALDRHGLETVTLNAFPYRNFHAPVVKKAVYHPDWTTAERLAYTLDCARVLSRLLPPDAARGSVSTVPLAWREPWDGGRRAAALDRLHRLAEGLAGLAAETGRTVRVGLEPEPGCTVETVAEAVEQLGGPGGVDTERIGICLDACHLAVAFEEPAAALDRLAAAGLPVVKTQASAALHAAAPGDPATRAALSRYTEDRFLHQVRERSPQAGGRVRRRDDLPGALHGPPPPAAATGTGASAAGTGTATATAAGPGPGPDGPLPGNGPWRVHFHVPVHQRPEPPLEATQDHLESTLRALFAGPAPLTDHVEAETYTWSVLPESRRPDGDAALAAGLAAELRWTAGALRRAGLTPAEEATP